MPHEIRVHGVLKVLTFLLGRSKQNKDLFVATNIFRNFATKYQYFSKGQDGSIEIINFDVETHTLADWKVEKE